MGRFGKCVLVILIIVGGIVGYFYYQKVEENKRLDEIKKGWYIEITYDEPINVRDAASTNGEIIGEAKKGEIYKVIDVDYKTNSSFNWYKIEFKKRAAYIASKKKVPWVNDVNNPNDIQTPTIKFENDTYHVTSINDINYKHLTIKDDRNDYTITHIIYHEVKPSMYIDQYWILYTVTDKSGKSSSKMQKIEFDIAPDESQVEDFANYRVK